MRTFCALAAASAILLAGCAHVQEKPAGPSAPPLVSNDRQGYAFPFPRVLAEQRLFGIAHGVALLADACHDDAAATEAYAQWRAHQRAPLDAIRDELAAFYYGPRASEATWANIAGTLHLRASLDLAPARLQEACASLPQALQLSRYDLSARLRLEAVLAQTALAVRVETQNETCATRLPERDRPALAEHYAAWQSRQGTAIADARTRLAEEWKINDMAGTTDDVLKALHHRYSNPPPATCAKLADWLDTPAANIDQAFMPAPAPAAVPPPLHETEPETGHNPVPMQTPAEIEAAAKAMPQERAEDTPRPNLFDQAIDHILKLFTEPAHEQQRPDEPAGTP